MNYKERIKSQIIQFLANSSFKDEPIKAIAGHIKKSRLTTAKYLMALESENKIKSRQVGNVILYSLSQDNQGGA